MRFWIGMILAALIIVGCTTQDAQKNPSPLPTETATEESTQLPSEQVTEVVDEALPEEELSTLAEETEPDLGDVVE